jgi:hypothetical protein
LVPRDARAVHVGEVWEVGVGGHIAAAFDVVRALLPAGEARLGWGVDVHV